RPPRGGPGPTECRHGSSTLNSQRSRLKTVDTFRYTPTGLNTLDVYRLSQPCPDLNFELFSCELSTLELVSGLSKLILAATQGLFWAFGAPSEHEVVEPWLKRQGY
ncbi:MAG: hypothetical protein MN733_38435, partial [Nitrososphaera sp.]|nr:hypothetical protein [Nitrososphaera sp.]